MNRITFTTPVLLLLMAGCSDAPRKTVEEKPPEPVSGRYALHQMYLAARSWGGDAQVLRLNSILLREVQQERGKAAAWEAFFVSPNLGKARSWTYSVIEGEGNLHKGVFAGPEQNWSGPRPTQQPFPMAAVKVDSHEAFETALKRAAEYEKKNPDKIITFILEKTPKHPNPAWRVLWGESVGTSNFSILVDASTGLYLETLR
jgi:hypothetical protein